MKTTVNALCLSALLLGAAALATPALAQAVTAPSGQASADAAAAPSDMSSTAAAKPSSGTSSNSMPSGAPGNGQTAMNSSGDLSAVPDTGRKYSRANRSADFAKEEQTTKQLNQQASLNAAGNSSVQ